MTTQPDETPTPEEVEAIVDDAIAALDMADHTVVNRTALAFAMGLPIPEADKCFACDASTKSNKQAIGVPLVTALRRLDEAGGGPINLRELGLGRNGSDNFQKLKYFDLVEKAYENGKRLGGQWKITDHGRAFVRGQARSHLWCQTFRDERTHYEGPAVLVDEVGTITYRQRHDYAADARPHAISAKKTPKKKAAKTKLAVVPDPPADPSGTHADGMPDVR